MKNFKLTSLMSLCIIISVSLMVTGCYPTERYERVVQLSEPLAPGNSFSTKTHNGYVHILGTQTNQCDITAKISGWGKSLERAQELSEAVNVRFENINGNLKVVLDKPATTGNEGTGVSLDVTLPSETSFDIQTHNGSLEIKNTSGDAKGKTHNGKIFIENLTGNMNFTTHNGQVNCQQVSGNSMLNTHNGNVSIKFSDLPGSNNNCQAHTHNGSVNIHYPSRAASPTDVKATTHNGSIKFYPPVEYSAQVTAKTHNGSVNSHRPVTVVGEIKKNHINGTIGSGEGSLYLQTHNGSIKIE